MSLRLLSAGEIDTIEERYRAGKLGADDMERLFHTVRRLMENVPSENIIPSGDSGDSVFAGANSNVCRPSNRAGHAALPLRNGNAKTGSEKIEIFTDGACKGNPGPGGWGALVRIGGREKELSGSASHTTNNRMEMTAVIEALASLPPSSRVVLTTDSQYIQKGITLWIRNWKKNGWLNASQEPVKNMDLWKKLDELSRKHTVEWRWVKGHAGHKENERCDELARMAVMKACRSR